jgi:isopropylmalate/homocitrate/citramalate synthase
MMEMTESQKKHLKELADRAHEKELTLELNRLYDKFQKWKSNEITPWDLNEILRQYHNDTANELFQTYVLVSDPREAVAKAIVNDILNIAEVNADCRPLLEGIIAFYRG